MAILKGIGLENFRVFETNQWFDLAAITILTGPNSSGKSSLNKAILLLKESRLLQYIDFTNPVHLLGNHDLCVNKKSKAKSIRFSFPITFDTIQNKFLLKLGFGQTNINKNVRSELTSLELIDKESSLCVLNIALKKNYWAIKINFEYLVLLFSTLETEAQKEGDNIKSLNETLNSLKLSDERYSEISSEIYYAEQDQRFHRLLANNNSIFNSNQPLFFPFYALKWKEFDIKSIADTSFRNMTFGGTGDPNQQIINRMEKDYVEQIESGDENVHMLDINDYKKSELEFLSNVEFRVPRIETQMGGDVLITMSNCITNLKFYVSRHLSQPLKENNRHKDFVWLFNNKKIWESKNFDIVMEYLFDFLFRRKAEEIETMFSQVNYLPSVRTVSQRVFAYYNPGVVLNELLRDYSAQPFMKNSDKYMFLVKWIREFGIGQEIDLEILHEGEGMKIKIDDCLLADMGYGVSQFLPILLKIVLMASQGIDDQERCYYISKTLIIEEPETNLHPMLQSKLSDMFVDASKQFNIQFVIETHSEYLIRKLQYLVAKKKIKPDDSVIYYFNDPKKIKKNQEQIIKIEILPDGRLSNNFGDGFFDESARLVSNIIEARSLN